MKCLYALLAIACLLAAAPASADRGTEDPRDGIDTLPTEIGQAGAGLNPTMRGEITFTGTVLGRDREAVPRIEVKLFIGGLRVESHLTDGVGQYNFARTIDFSRDETVILLLSDPSGQLAPKAFVLAESDASRENQLLSACFPRLRVETTIESTIYLFDSETKSKALADRGCI